jgi:ribosomal protein S18 acetylase RimI-like enzyme
MLYFGAVKPNNDLRWAARCAATVLRPAELSDAPALAAFAEKSFRETFGSDNTPEDMNQYCLTAFGPDVQRRELLDPAVSTVLALSEDTIVGYGQVRLGSKAKCIASDNAAEIQRLYVDSAWQGRKLAFEILQALVKAATVSGAECIWLGVWERNARAIRFYEKVGFTVAGEHSFKLGNDVQRDLVLELVCLVQ